MIRKMKSDEQDERMELSRPELPTDEAQENVKGGLWRMLGCCALVIALLRALWLLF